MKVKFEKLTARKRRAQLEKLKEPPREEKRLLSEWFKRKPGDGSDKIESW